MQAHNATTTEQRQEVVGRLASALLENWDGDLTWQTLGQFLTCWVVNPDLENMRDTQIVELFETASYEGCSGGGGEWETFPEMTDEWRAELRRRYFDPELRQTVDHNELRAKGIIGAEE